MLNIDEINESLHCIALSFVDDLSISGVKFIIGLLNVREYNIAFETLCDNLIEKKAKIPYDIYIQLTGIGTHLNVKSAYWEGLQSRGLVVR